MGGGELEKLKWGCWASAINKRSVAPWKLYGGKLTNHRFSRLSTIRSKKAPTRLADGEASLDPLRSVQFSSGRRLGAAALHSAGLLCGVPPQGGHP